MRNKGSYVITTLLIAVFIVSAHAEILLTMGTPENPTIDSEYINKPPTQSTESLIPEINHTLLNQDALHNETEKKITQLLEQAARGGKLSYVLNAAKQYELPASVALIPMIESNYNAHAISPKGATGLWQLSSAVSKDYQLPLNKRTDWKSSTHVAMQHIKTLYQHYHRWDLVWAAYNAGQGRVDNALKKSSSQSFQSLTLPLETKNYVTQLTRIKNSLLV